MASFVISVSLRTGCYRHIRISKSATLYMLHKAIINAFDFDDDHGHAFFMDNRLWSHEDAYFSHDMGGLERATLKYKLNRIGLKVGDRFKYVFDFGDEWSFGCRVLRETDENADIPYVVRRVGESPEQYPQEEPEDLYDLLSADAPIPPEVIQKLYDMVPLHPKTVKTIHQYFEAAARLYGEIPVLELMEIYNQQNQPVDKGSFILVAWIIRLEDSDIFVVGPENFDDSIQINPDMWVVAADYLFSDDTDDFFKLAYEQAGKPCKILPKSEFLKYADPDYYPVTIQSLAMEKYLRRKKELKWPDDILMGLQTMIEIDFSIGEVIAVLEDEGLVFQNISDVEEFMNLFQALNNNSRKHSNRGHTPMELAMCNGQTDLIALQSAKPKEPSKNGPCPCGSGKKYKRCCGKDK